MRSDEAYKGGGMKTWILADVAKQLELGYRAFFFIESKEYLGLVTELAKHLTKGKKRLAYAFHPWIEGAKDRMKGILSEFSGELIDIDYSHSDEYLGITVEGLFLDCVDDFRPNYIARLVDTVKGGGFIVMFTDDLSSNKLYKSTITRNGVVDSYFEDRFRRIAKRTKGVYYQRDEEVYFEPFLEKPKETKWTNWKGVKVTEDQAKVINESDFLFHSDDPRVYLITSPRGRGKSASAGLIAGDLARSRENFRAIVVSKNLLNSQEIMKFSSVFKGAVQRRTKDGLVKAVRYGSSLIEWLPPELAVYATGDLLIIDEFASIQSELLEELLRRWRKVIMLSTTFGYEGSGKAFLKLLKRLKQTHLVKHVTMESPVRYPGNDPVENFMNDAFLLKFGETRYPQKGGITEVSREDLAKNEGLLRSVYSILFTAHYRNSPDDLMFLLDMAFQRVLTFSDGKSVKGVEELVYEGGLTEEEVKRIREGEDNLGHLIPHRLIKYLDAINFAKYKGLRVMRIAVREEDQGKGIGSALLKEAESLARREGLDWLGSSFIADYQVLRFWIKNGFRPVHLASRANQDYGGFSVVVLKPLSPDLEGFVREMSRRLKEKLVLTAHQVYYKLSPLVIALLLKHTEPLGWKPEVSEYDLRRIEEYLSGSLPYNAVADSVHKVLMNYLAGEVKLKDEDLAVLVARVLQGRSWSQVAQALGLGGSKAAERAFRDALNALLRAFFSNERDSSS